MTHLIYVADPMCSWCYGFGPELAAVADALPQARIDIVLGGLRAGHTQRMDADMKATLLSHWRDVADATGLPFSDAALSHPGFVYDTEPACRAVVAARRLAPGVPHAALRVFGAIQAAFYARGQDVTQGGTLTAVAVEALAAAPGVPSIDAAGFRAAWASDAAIADTRADFAQTQRWRISGFPTLLLAGSDGLHLLARGFARKGVVLERIGAATCGDE